LHGISKTQQSGSESCSIITLEFLPDGEQVLRVALADQTEPVLINKRGDESFEGEEWQHHTNLANKWLQIDYHITTHKED